MKQVYTIEEINDHLFNGVRKKPIPKSLLKPRNQDYYKPKINIDEIKSTVTGKYQNNILIYNGGVTDIQIPEGKTGALCTSNNGDLFTGCNYEIARAVINAAGAGLQTELYNTHGMPGCMQVLQGMKPGDAGRGYAITCESYDMKESHNIDKIELLTVPFEEKKGVVNMYYEALKHSQNLDYILVPTAGMTHKALGYSFDNSARLTMEGFVKFRNECPDSKLKVIFTLFEAQAIAHYEKHVTVEDSYSAKAINNQKLEDIKNVADQSDLKSVENVPSANQSDNVEILADDGQIDSSIHQ